MRDWVKRAESFKSQEHSIKSRLDPHIQTILSQKRILLWKSLLEQYQYPDMRVVDELLEVPATMSEIEKESLSAVK